MKTTVDESESPTCPVCKVLGYWDGQWWCSECDRLLKGKPPRIATQYLYPHPECPGCDHADVDDGRFRCRASRCVLAYEED